MIVLDASALLALINREPGWEAVARAPTNQDATISSVDYAEVLQKSARLGVGAEIVDSVMDALAVAATPLVVSTPDWQRPSTGTDPGRAWPTGFASLWQEACRVPPSRVMVCGLGALRNSAWT